MKMKIIGIRTKTKYINKPTEYRDNSPYWQKRLLNPELTHFYKHNQHGFKSPLFKIISVEIVDAPKRYLEQGVLHAEKAILIVGRSNLRWQH